MTFAAPLFLIAALAAAIPVILHLINRQKAKDLPFSTLRFLRISAEKTRRRRRIHDLLLMLLRAAVLVLIALGLAGPTLTHLGALWGGARSAVVIILDNSASMGTLDQERLRFETATDAATQILDELGPDDQVALMLTGGPKFPEQGRFDRTHEKVRQMLAQCIVSYETADLGPKVEEARKLLEKSKAANKHIYVITDLQKHAWENLAATKDEPEATGAEDTADAAKSPAADDQQVPIIVVDCNRAPVPDVAVQGVALSTGVPVAGVPLRATVELLNASPVEQQRHVELVVDGAKVASSPAISIPAGGRLQHDFLFAFERGGLRRGEVRLLGVDGSAYDDRRFFAVEVDQGIPVAVVKPERHEIPYLEESYYLELALNPGRSGGWAIRPSALVAADLVSEPLSDYKVIFCVNLPAPDADTAQRLRDYVTAGGNLVWILGDNVTPRDYDRLDEQLGAKLLPAPLLDVRSPQPGGDRDSWSVGFLDAEHPALSNLVEPAGLYQSVLVYQHVRIAASEENAVRVLARLDDGEPLLVERQVEKGKVLLLGTSVHVDWTNLPLKKIFLPLVANLVFELSGAERARYDTLAGSPLVLPLTDTAGPVGVEILPPTGETIRRTTDEDETASDDVFRYTDTHQIGIYLVRRLDTVPPLEIAYSVNVDPEEADPETIDREELQKRFAPAPLVFAENPDDLSSTFAWLREGESLWGLFLAGVLIALIFESFLANRLTPKLDEDQAGQAPPGMRRLGRRGRGAAAREMLGR